MRETGKIALGSVTTIAINSTIQFLVAGNPFKAVPDRSVGLNDWLALSLELGVSAGSFAVFGELPALLGAAEALTFFGLKAVGVGPEAKRPVTLPPPTARTSSPSQSASAAMAPRVPPPEGSDANPADFYQGEDFANPESFANAEDFSNPENLLGIPRFIRR